MTYARRKNAWTAWEHEDLANELSAFHALSKRIEANPMSKALLPASYLEVTPGQILCVYVAGPYSRTGEQEALGMSHTEAIAYNVAEAQLIGAKLIERGFCPIVPHNLSLGAFPEAQNQEWWLRAMLTVMRRCDAVVLSPRWQQSQGAIGEEGVSHQLSIPVYLWTEALPQVILPVVG
jgi:hypothetical protein